MKIVNYILAGLAGAVAAGVAMYHLGGRVEVVERVREVRVTLPAEPEGGAAVEAVVRLTREKAELQTELKDVRETLTAADVTLRQTQEKLAELRRPMDLDIYSTALKAELKSGEVVVTGGYRLPDGKRLYAFAQPVVEMVEGATVVRVTGQFVALNDEAGKGVGLDSLSTNANNTLQHGEVWVKDEQAEVMSRVTGMTGVDVVKMKDIAIVSGDSGVISIGNIRVTVAPVVTDDRGSMTMELRLEQSPVPPDDQKRAVNWAP